MAAGSKNARRLTAILTAEGMLVEARLREISDEIVQLREFVSVEPNNQLLINLLEAERQTIKHHYITAVPNDRSSKQKELSVSPEGACPD